MKDTSSDLRSLETVSAGNVHDAEWESILTGTHPDADTAVARFEDRRANQSQRYQKVLVMILGWVVLAVIVMRMININVPTPAQRLWEIPGYSGHWGYTLSLAISLTPLVALFFWYFYFSKKPDFPPLIKAVLAKAAVTGAMWVGLDVLFANKFFTFPDERARLLFMIPGYSWEGSCTTLSSMLNLQCYTLSIPLEEVIFYLSCGFLLTMLYMWANEDFLHRHGIERKAYEALARRTPPLVNWNKKLIVFGIALAVAAIVVKRFGPQLDLHQQPDGWPFYFLAQLVIVFVPLSALYNRVRVFTNPQAFLYVMELQLLISVIWESTLAVPYGWWGYRPESMMGVTITPWSHLPIEAAILWLAIGWSSLFIYEAGKIQILSGKSWRQVLFG